MTISSFLEKWRGRLTDVENILNHKDYSNTSIPIFCNLPFKLDTENGVQYGDFT
ncbi:MAG TPA: hypothetical protein VF540_07855 [Segetibacter sp.]